MRIAAFSGPSTYEKFREHVSQCVWSSSNCRKAACFRFTLLQERLKYLEVGHDVLRQLILDLHNCSETGKNLHRSQFSR